MHGVCSNGRQRQSKSSGQIIVSGLKASYATITKVVSRTVEISLLLIKYILQLCLNGQLLSPHLNQKQILSFPQTDGITLRLDKTAGPNVFLCSAQPFRYSSLVTSQRAKAIIALCWVLSVGIGLTPMLGWKRGRRYILSNMLIKVS